jgi:glucosamine-6-phosphate deaminase
VLDDPSQLASAAAADAAARIRTAIDQRGGARLVAATGASQILFLDRLVREPGVDWSRVELFHLDEYIGLPIDHPASFRKYLLERLVRPAGITRYHLLDGEQDAAAVCREAGRLLRQAPVDLALAGIGENGHLAFNDPPADFDAEDPYLVVRLDDRCRRQRRRGLVRPAGDAGRTAILDVGPADSSRPARSCASCRTGGRPRRCA